MKGKILLLSRFKFETENIAKDDFFVESNKTSVVFPVQNVLKQGDVLSQLLFKFSAEYVTRKA